MLSNYAQRKTNPKSEMIISRRNAVYGQNAVRTHLISVFIRTPTDKSGGSKNVVNFQFNVLHISVRFDLSALRHSITVTQINR